MSTYPQPSSSMILDQIKSHLREIRTQEAIAAQATTAADQIRRVADVLTADLSEPEKAELEVWVKANTPKTK